MKTLSCIAKGAIVAAMTVVAMPANYVSAAEINGWGDRKLYMDPGHEGRSNTGLWGYSEAEKVLRVALNIKNMLETYTDIPAENLKLCRYTDEESISLEERSDEANAWGADFYYSIHSDAGGNNNTIVTLFGGWRKDGVDIEKTPNGGKAYGDILEPNLSGAMRIGSRGNWYDRCFYDKSATTHTNQYPYLSVNRRSNMPSLLSEGGYHTISFQQQRNMNDDYKRIEALAAFQSLLKYFNLDVPAMTMLTGMITNSENDQPINGAVVTVDGKTYTTDTYESLFHKYTKNENLIHNGFYLFEGLTAGQEYEVEIAAEGYDTVKKNVTINAGGEHTSDYITFLDVAMTNNAPAKVDAISLSDLSSVSPIYPLTITFSRNMVRESVEQAFSINNRGEVELSWDNDYTLNVDLSKLEPLFEYTITIDSSVAKNSQTQQMLDGDGDGVEGGNYVLTFTMAEPDNDPAEVVSTYPAAEGEAVFTQRPPIRIEYNELIDWNDDKFADFITVSDAEGNVYPGTISHANITEKSVLHYYLNQDLPADKAILVVVAAGLPDLSGNLTKQFAFRFLTEYREKADETTVFDLVDNGKFWDCEGSGSTTGIDNEASNLFVANVGPSKDIKTSHAFTYVFDPGASAWYIRNHCPNTVTLKDAKGVMTMWVYGDGSNNITGTLMRNGADNGLKYKAEEMVLNFRGWNLYTWDFQNDEWKAFTGDGTKITKFTTDAIYLNHTSDITDPEEADEDNPYQAWEGSMAYNSWFYSHWNEGTRTASIEDVKLPEDIESVKDIEAAKVAIVCNGNTVNVYSPSRVKSIEVYNMAGALVAKTTGKASVSVADIANGVYVVKATTTGTTVAAKIVK